jgi:3-hydroxybutyryl-CoA dehydrogenase
MVLCFAGLQKMVKGVHMKIEDIQKVCVLGAGNMGHQISLLCAIHGYHTICTDVSEEVLKRAESFADNYLAGRVEKEKMTSQEAEAAGERIVFTTALEEAVQNADYVIEAVTEVLEVKRKLFSVIDKLAPKHAVFATNSSTFVSSLIADATRRPSQILNLHFFNPALVMKLVEVVKGPHVSEATIAVSFQLCEKLDKIPVLIQKEVEGFLLNRIFRAIYNEALWLLDMGVAGVEDIDKACVHGAGHPMGPFRLMDLTGIDLNHRIQMEKFRHTGQPADRPSPSVVEKVSKGEYGEKTGKGWYDYGEK